MSFFINRATAAVFFVADEPRKTEMQIEEELFVGRSEELARLARRQRFARIAGSVTAVWTLALNRLTEKSRKAQAHKDLMDRLENMPAYMLRDIGVSRSNKGSLCYYNDFGVQVEFAPELDASPSNEPTKEKADMEPAHASAYAR